MQDKMGQRDEVSVELNDAIKPDPREPFLGSATENLEDYDDDEDGFIIEEDDDYEDLPDDDEVPLEDEEDQ